MCAVLIIKHINKIENKKYHLTKTKKKKWMHTNYSR